MRKAYIALSFENRVVLNPAVQTICSALEASGMQPWVFVNQYIFLQGEEKEMMQSAFADILAADLFICEASFKEIGIGIEAGYAKASGKKVIYLRNHLAAPSTTLTGLCDELVVYESMEDLHEKLSGVLKKFKSDILNTIHS